MFPCSQPPHASARGCVFDAAANWNRTTCDLWFRFVRPHESAGEFGWFFNKSAHFPVPVYEYNEHQRSSTGEWCWPMETVGAHYSHTSPINHRQWPAAGKSRVNKVRSRGLNLARIVRWPKLDEKERHQLGQQIYCATEGSPILHCSLNSSQFNLGNIGSHAGANVQS